MSTGTPRYFNYAPRIEEISDDESETESYYPLYADNEEIIFTLPPNRRLLFDTPPPNLRLFESEFETEVLLN